MESLIAMAETAGYYFTQEPKPEVWRPEIRLTHQEFWLLRAAARYLALAADQGQVELHPDDRSQLDRLAELMLRQVQRTDKPQHSMHPQRYLYLDFHDFDEAEEEWLKRFGHLELVKLSDLVGEVRFLEPQAARLSITKGRREGNP